MISGIGIGNTGGERPEGVGRSEGAQPHARPQDSRAGSADRMALDYRELGALHASLPPPLQEALERAVGGAADVEALRETAGRPDVMDVLDRALNLNGGGVGSLLGVLGEMSREELETALKALADLLRHGVVGYEYREVNGEPMKVFIDVAIGSDLHRAPLVRDPEFDGLF